jgi:long-chain acyl-CoA synthetase
MPLQLHEEIDRVLEGWGDHPALVDATPGAPTQALSAQGLRAGVREVAAALARSGIAPHVPVALVLDNTVDFVRVFLALLRIGAIPVPLKPEYRSLELQRIFADSRPGAIVAERRYLDGLAPYLAGRTVVSHAGETLHLEREATGRPEPAEVDRDVASLNFTYRGLGYPLGSMVTHAQYLDGARALQDGLQGSRGQRMLGLLPMSAIFSLEACMLVPLLYGMTAVIVRTMHPRHLYRVIEEQAIDYVTAVPELYLLLARMKGEGVRLPTLKALVSGGSALGADEYEELTRVLGAEVLHGYGLTEFAPVSRNLRGHARAGTVGPVSASVETRIDAPDDSGVGEIVLRTPSMSRGYYGRPQETAEAFQSGWLRTGDLGRMEGDHLLFVAEKKRTCKVNGNIVDFSEVESAIRLFDGVGECRLERRGGGLHADVVPCRAGDSASMPREIRAFLRERLSAHKVPRSIAILRPERADSREHAGDSTQPGR